MNTSSTNLTVPVPVHEQPNRLAPIRRLYFYVVALISLIAGLVGLDELLRFLSDRWIAAPILDSLYDADFARRMIAQNGGLLLVATPLFLLHWGFMQGHLDEPGERGAGLRKLFLYLVSAVAVIYALVNGYALLNGLANLALGEALNVSPLWPSAWLHHIAMLLVGVGLQAYFHTVLRNDGDYGQEQGLAGTWRRLYQTLTGLAGLGMLLQGGSDILGAGWQALFDTQTAQLTTGYGWLRYQLSDGITFTLLGAILLRVNWQRWRAITEHSAVEATSALRRFYLYAAVVISALATLIPAANALRLVLLILLGSNLLTWAELPDRLASSLPYLPVGLAAWIWYWRFLRAEATQFGESSEGATVRRLYYYAVAATGLGLLWYGAVSVLQAFLDRFLVASAGEFWLELLATGLSLLIVGAPVWAVHWQTAQRLARRADAAGAQERASLPRRIYLYGVALAGALLILFHLAQVVYRFLLLLLGEPDAALFSAATVNDLARSVIAAGLWLVHLLAIRGDARFGIVEATPSGTPVVADRAALEQRIARLEAELAAAKAALAALPPPQGGQAAEKPIES
jgi:hypothetical protein